MKLLIFPTLEDPEKLAALAALPKVISEAKSPANLQEWIVPTVTQVGAVAAVFHRLLRDKFYFAP